MERDEESYLVSKEQYQLSQKKRHMLTSAICLALAHPGWAPAYRMSLVQEDSQCTRAA